MARYVVIGGGIVGAATAHRLLLERPGSQVVVLEKEQTWAAHQTGRNSGVIHAGVYYTPGSLKARLSKAGSESMVAFAREHDIPYEICGKLVVATHPAELERLHALQERALANGLPVRMVDTAEAAEIEPHVNAVAALLSPTTGIIDYAAVTRTLADLAAAAGADLRLGHRVVGIRTVPGGVRVETDHGDVDADVLINCAGLHSDRIARLAGLEPEATIVPFRGEYYELVPERRHLVKGLIYPVPDPEFPFLGVHLTRGIDGGVHAGPNAVLALSREGYDWRTFNGRDLSQALGFSGFRALARKHYRMGALEVARSLSTKRFADSLARLVPEVTKADLVKAAAGVRAQALTRDGRLVDDFLIQSVPGQVHVLNAPSPAATSSLEIARHIVSEIPELP